MSIGKNIRKARQEADMTQEQLAELLNISVSAVSQWESDKTTPDISMIPALCNVFQMTSDKLLDIELEKNEEAIEAIRAEANWFASKGKGLEAEKVLRDGLRKYPNSYGIMMDLMKLIRNSMKNWYRKSIWSRLSAMQNVLLMTVKMMLYVAVRSRFAALFMLMLESMIRPCQLRKLWTVWLVVRKQ